MKNPFLARGPTGMDAAAINDTIQRALASAGIDTASGPMRGVTDTIRSALASAGLSGAAAPTAQARAADPVDNDGELHVLGGFSAHSFRNAAGSRAYKLYLPDGTSDAPRPLVVMLHGCTQSADDFAAGTQMNRLADTHGFIVVYPEQAAQANSSKCWNWFSPADQVRDGGEPAIIAGIVREVAARHVGDTRRIFVAGLSAGAAMAVVMGETYPELFAGVGVHSGLPYASAHDIPSALSAMKGGRSAPARRLSATTPPLVHAVPTIVFHGDRDHTVQHANGVAVVDQAKQAHGAALTARSSEGEASGGRRYTRTVHATGDGPAHIESWTLHGAGHAWSGGHASGSYTDGKGPDASAEMLRFFLALAPGQA